MKFKLYLIGFLLFFNACDKTDEPIFVDENLIAGKWVLTEAYISAGGPQYWIDIDNGEEIEFFENGTFSSNKFSECITGNFSIVENKLLLKYNCIGFTSNAENEDGFITYKLEFFSDYFILTPTSGAICIEGCSSKYQKKK
ncbi:hypothetical protein MBM09_04705 [Flaviramulus sp. BrNp1-15]|uniref:hypothetical protein n=1 Tax=Flaviramulus sp. BrNp1-15 TaxID=2916754 RepID=UPI001EE818E2|nr:hypothetical protein [Flaviramulus sp. BrNp1-15]ULC60292.1 hypothetical protein MBM09_04705 [Flaviramulus sp. BrNp1-15]